MNLTRTAALASLLLALVVTAPDVAAQAKSKIHDIIEPQIPQARPDLVYPQLIEIIEMP